jgi:exodeoxyribonuclease V alpha subunit
VTIVAEIGRARAAGAIRDLDYYLAAHLLALAPRPSADLALAITAVSRANGDGDVCLDLGAIAGTRVLADGASPEWHGIAAPALAQWTATLRDSGIVGVPGEVQPLILDAAGRLYLAKYFDFEQAIAAGLRQRLAFRDDVDPGRLATLLGRYFPATAATDGQKLAAALAVLRSLAVISGGPGTGKTYTVARILALLVDLAQSDRLRIRLAAPTGKAAARLAEAIQQGVEALRQDPATAAVAQRIPTEASTLHRLLGYGRGGFRHDAADPLSLDVLVVDEASMVDVPLMARLLRATPAGARVILLGDRDQLASVEAGSALGDICNHGAPTAWTAELDARMRSLGLEPPPSPRAAPRGPMADSLALLTESRRFSATSAIGALARATNAGDVAAAFDVLATGGEVNWRTLSKDALAGAIEAEVGAWLAGYRGTADPVEAMRRFNGFRVLCAVREGPWGVSALNAQVERALAHLGVLAPAEGHYAGRPILVTQNDYAVRLFNGDVGLVLPDPAAGGALRVFFVQPGGEVRRVLPSRLPPHETCFAMTVHKSQGSEFDRVVVVLPERDSRVLTRELVYTAVTRAKRSVAIWSPQDVLATAIGRRVERSSGLRDVLWKTVGLGSATASTGGADRVDSSGGLA